MIISLTSIAFAAGEKYDGIFDRPTHYPGFDPMAASGAANNMTYFVYVVNTDGKTLENFEIGVYDKKDKLRAISRSRHEDKEQCMLTIIGDLGEEFHFEVVYGDFDNPTIQPLEEVVPFVINGVYGGKEDVFFHVKAEPVLKYWTTDYISAIPQGELKASELTGADLKAITRAELSGSWTEESAEGLFAGCKSLLYVNFFSMPGTTTDAFKDANPNCLVYLPTGTTEVPTGWTNCVADGKALTDINLTDGTTTQTCPFYCPQTIDLDGHQATFHRSSPWSYANGKGGWNTIILPFDAEVQADGEPISAFSNLSPTSAQWKKKAGYWACYLETGCEGELEFVLTQTLSANTPYLFALPSHNFEKTVSGMTYSLDMEGKEIVFIGTDEIPATTATLVCEDEAEDNDCHLLGTYQTIKGQPMYQLKTNVADGSDAFVYREKGNLLPFRAYLAQDDASSVKADMMVINLGWEEYGDTTDGLSMTATDADGQKVYDLSGRIVTEQPTHGIYVLNGRKVIK